MHTYIHTAARSHTHTHTHRHMHTLYTHTHTYKHIHIHVGGFVALIYNASTGQVTTIDAREESPAAVSVAPILGHLYACMYLCMYVYMYMYV
jgi:hypothetical protein